MASSAITIGVGASLDLADAASLVGQWRRGSHGAMGKGGERSQMGGEWRSQASGSGERESRAWGGWAGRRALVPASPAGRVMAAAGRFPGDGALACRGILAATLALLAAALAGWGVLAASVRRGCASWQVSRRVGGVPSCSGRCRGSVRGCTWEGVEAEESRRNFTGTGAWRGESGPDQGWKGE